MRNRLGRCAVCDSTPWSGHQFFAAHPGAVSSASSTLWPLKSQPQLCLRGFVVEACAVERRRQCLLGPGRATCELGQLVLFRLGSALGRPTLEVQHVFLLLHKSFTVVRRALKVVMRSASFSPIAMWLSADVWMPAKAFRKQGISPSGNVLAEGFPGKVHHVRGGAQILPRRSGHGRIPVNRGARGCARETIPGGRLVDVAAVADACGVLSIISSLGKSPPMYLCATPAKESERYSVNRIGEVDLIAPLGDMRNMRL